MTETQVQGNKLIAEFMDGKTEPTPQGFATGLVYRFPNRQSYYYPSGLQYHTSWDWLKPVIDKIFEYAVAYPERVRDIRGTSIVVEIDAAWRKCVEFIKWYNQTNSK